MQYRPIAISFALLGTLLIASSASAQGRGGSFYNAPMTNGFQQVPMRQASSVGFHGRAGHALRRYHGYFYPGYGPYFYDSGYNYDDGSGETPPPAKPPAPAPPEVHKAADSVVMELRGDRWVRLTSTGPIEPAARAAATEPSRGVTAAMALPAFDQAPAAAPLPAAILVFRDGHREEAVKYTIVGNAIYLKGDYYATGSWTRRVQTAELDLPATLKLNSERGTRFSLPSRPSEVMLRP